MRNKFINSVLVPIHDKPLQVYLSPVIQSADVLEWILSQLGASEIWQTSFSISEEYLRRLTLLSRNEFITAYTLILDFKATNKTVKLWPMLSQCITQTYLSANHSKVLLVKSVSGQKVSVITSQNLTRGNRLEATIVASVDEIFDTLYAQIKEVTNHAINFDDVYRRAINAD